MELQVDLHSLVYNFKSYIFALGLVLGFERIGIGNGY